VQGRQVGHAGACCDGFSGGPLSSSTQAGREISRREDSSGAMDQDCPVRATRQPGDLHHAGGTSLDVGKERLVVAPAGCGVGGGQDAAVEVGGAPQRVAGAGEDQGAGVGSGGLLGAGLGGAVGEPGGEG